MAWGGTEMPQITIDGKSYEVPTGSNLLEAVLGLGLDLPYFCWHPAMGSVGSCRQCAMLQFQNEDDDRGRLVMACMTPVSDGMLLSLSNEKAVDFRSDVIEALMTNHPHDCPVCAEGGECHLQDMTVMSGHRERRYEGLKNTHQNQYLGPLINHEMNRCIACYRCVRYYRDYAGGTDLAALGSHDHVYFGRHEDGVLESEFAGNLVEVCPTGVFTDKSLVNDYTRKWDLQSAPSICTGCGMGCNTTPGERYGRLKRVHNRYHHEVNGYFLCDRGRFGGTFVNSDKRLTKAGRKGADGKFVPLTTEQAHAALVELCAVQGAIVGVGSPRASLESNWLLREAVGAENFSSGLGAEADAVYAIVDALRLGGVPSATLPEIEAADLVIILGEDVTQTAPRIALALRQSVRNKGLQMAANIGVQYWQDTAVRNISQNERSPLVQLQSASTRLDDVTSHALGLAPNDIARLGLALAHALGEGDPIAGLTGEQQAWIDAVVGLFAHAERPLIISGSGAHNADVVAAARALSVASSRMNANTRVVYAVPECNSLGSALLDPGGLSMQALADKARTGDIETLIVMENDLWRRAPRETVDALLSHVPNVVVMDVVESATADYASLVLPVASYAEAEGTLVSSEGRAQRFFPPMQCPDERAPSWHWLRNATDRGRTMGLASLSHLDDVLAALADDMPALAGAVTAAPGAGYRDRIGLKAARQPIRYSGRTAMYADKTMHEPKTRVDEDSSLNYSMEGDNHGLPSALRPFVWDPGWNSNQSLHKFQDEIGGALTGGSAGTRLIEPGDGSLAATIVPPSAFEPRLESFCLTPQYQIFGSDELSLHADSIADMVGLPVVRVAIGDAQRLGVTTHDGLAVIIDEVAVKCALAIDARVPEGTLGYTVGHPATLALQSGQYVKVECLPNFCRKPEVIARDGVAAHG